MNTSFKHCMYRHHTVRVILLIVSGERPANTNKYTEMEEQISIGIETLHLQLVCSRVTLSEFVYFLLIFFLY